jgi:NAD+ synthase (glutamine-hydrolysing)
MVCGADLAIRLVPEKPGAKVEAHLRATKASGQEQEKMQHPFYNLYTHGLVRAAVCLPFVKVAEPNYNTERTLALAKQAAAQGAALALFPELGISAYSNEDLFHQDALLDATEENLAKIVEDSKGLPTILIVGAPLRFEQKLFNCGLVIYQGKILAISPKSYLPNYREFYEKRQFAAGRDAVQKTITLFGQEIPFGNDIVVEATNIKNFSLHVEICEDVWTPIPPSVFAALAGATVLTNLSASNITVGKAEYRHSLCSSQSAKCVAAYLYAAAGPGESTTDLAWDGHAMIYENGDALAVSERFTPEEDLIIADIDLERLAQDRMRLSSFSDTVNDHKERLRQIRKVRFQFEAPFVGDLKRKIERYPYVPSKASVRNERCYEAYNIQVHGLLKRMQSTSIKKIVIGVSGGLDSTHALIVAAKTMEQLGLPRTNILGYTMPGFATSDSTKSNAHQLMNALGISAAELDIKPSCVQMLKDLNHPFADGQPVYDITFENVQAGERTNHLFRLANHHNAMVLGTGDLSELALGWCTYGVGDHMSHYNVNGSVPKTLIQYLIRWVIASKQFNNEANAVLQSIVDTEISPELIPGGDKNKPTQSTQQTIGPYNLQDFNIYYTTRFGFRPSKVAYLSYHAWANKTQGDWPDVVSEENRIEYPLAEIKKWLDVFLWRFFQTSQFKRSCVPNGPKVGSGGSLSPRGDWRAPSDSESRVWKEELKKNVPD